MAMHFEEMRAELRDFYEHTVNDRAAAFCEATTKKLDALFCEGMSVYAQKALQYRTITEDFEPVIFQNCPFYFELGTMCAQCDGARDWREGHKHAGGFVYRRNAHLFKTLQPALYALKKAQAAELLYLICGPFNDVSQHFCFNHRPLLREGIRGVYARAAAELAKATDETERAYLEATCEGLLCLARIAEKFAKKAADLAAKCENEGERMRYLRIAESAARCPYEPPQSFFEALNLLAFCRKALGALEGVGFSSFGRVDMDLYPFYERDLREGRLSEEEAYALISQFLITFDMHYDHDMKMVYYSDHELENTYTLGGCDEAGEPLCNDLTLMFLRASREEGIIYPKIKVRYGKRSPKVYLDEVNRAVIKGTSTVLYQNDDATIPALLRGGRTLQEARDYIISGCWDLKCVGLEKPDAGNYVNLLKAFELSLHRREDVMERVGLHFAPIDGAADFEEVYRITLDNIRILFEARARISREGGHIWDRVDVLPLFSCTLGDCLARHRDFTAGGARYRDEHFLCFGLPNIVDSLMAIKTLCFERRTCTLAELLTAVRNNWQGAELLRAEALRCSGWGDGKKESTALAARFNADLDALLANIPGSFGGRIRLGHLTYTEIKWWGEQTAATPDGRYAGDYFSQGLTPSRLKHLPAVTSVITSLRALAPAMMGANSVVNIILPSTRMDLDICEAFLRAAADSALQCLQLNCTTKEQLLDAQRHPEKYPDLIVRVCGFSAKFTALSPAWQDEVLTRNFYE